MEIGSSCLIEMYGCCGLLLLLDSSGASVDGEVGIGSNALLRKVTSLERSIRLGCRLRREDDV